MSTPKFDHRVVVICDPTRYQLDHGGALFDLIELFISNATRVLNLYLKIT